MKNYYLTLIENFIGIGYLILFLLGFFTSNLNFYHIGGIGMLVFMFIMIKGQPGNLFSFIVISGIGCIVAYFVSKWWLGLFWVSAFYSAGQLFGIIALIKNKEQIIEQIEEQEIETTDLLKYATSGKMADPDKIKFVEILFFIALIFGPYLFVNNLTDSFTANLSNNNNNNNNNTEINSLEKDIKQQIIYMEKSKDFSNQGVKIINSNDSQILSQNEINSYKEFLKKSIAEARKVDSSLLNKVKPDYGTVYYVKYIKAKELELKGYENGDAKSLTKGQLLYDEFVDWMQTNMK